MLQLIMASLLVAAPVKTTAARPAHVVAVDELLPAAVTALRSGDLARVEQLAARLVELAPTDPGAKLLLGAVVEASVPDRAAALFKQAGGVAPLPSLPPVRAVVAPGTGYVAATAANVRQRAEDDAALLGVLPIGTRVVVAERAGKFVKVSAVTPLRVMAKVDGGESTSGSAPETTAAPSPVDGFVAAELLDAEPPPRRDAFARRAAAARGALEKLAVMTRAHALWPEDRSLLVGLRDAAIEARHWWYAVAAERLLLALEAKERPLAVELQHLFGCRGDWRQAVTVRPRVELRTVRKLEPSHFAASGGPLDELPRHACLADFAEAQPPCPYCEEYSCEAGIDELSEEERQRFYRERDQYYSDQQSASANEIAAHGRFVETVAGLFSAQPLIKVTLRNRSLTVRGPRSLYLFAFSVRVSGGCNDGTLSAEISEATVAPIVVPAIRAGGSAEVIFRVPQYVNTFYGALEAPDLTTARARARARAEDVSRELRDQAMTSSTEKTVTIRPGEAWTHGKICCCYRV